MSLLYEMLARCGEWLRRRERRSETRDQPYDRERFWSEFREGQRQAKETSSENAARTGRNT